MVSVGRGIVLRRIDRLFGEGTLTGLGDGQLLERYLTRRDEDAFEALVDLHGPMVLGLCRRMLRDPRDIEDAFQATFLVLVRKAPAIRDRKLLSNWLYGVAFRVARRARTRMLRRRDREATVGELEFAAEPEMSERTEFDPTLDQELSRLPEKYRVPLVLCYLRGLTHEQAAAELRCPVGTVRSRLARGRDLLRTRLTRRGFAPTAMAAFLGGDAALPARLLVATVPPPMAAATVRAALGFGSSDVLKAGALSLALAQGVLTTMKLTQIKWIGLAMLAAGLSAGGVVVAGYAAVTHQEAPVAKSPAGAGSSDAEQEKEVQSPSRTTEERLKSLEDKIDRLAARLSTTSTLSEVAGAEVAPNPPPGEVPSDDRRARARPIRSGPEQVAAPTPIGELEAQLKLAIDEHSRTFQLVQRTVIGESALFRAGGKVLIIAAQVEALDDDLKDELDRLQLERRRKAALLDKARAEEDMAATLVARDRHLNQRKPGIVDAETVAKTEAQLKAAAAETKVAEVGVAEVELRTRQLERKRDRIKEVVKLARQAKPGLPKARPARLPSK